MSSFKKQAIKLKQEFQEKGFAVPLVSVQEALARSYGFNNRHVALDKEKEINSLFAALHHSDGEKKEVEFPEFITKDNFQNYPYTFSDDSDDDQYLSGFADLEIFNGAKPKNGMRITMFKPASDKVVLSDIVQINNEELDDIYESWDWVNEIPELVAQLTVHSFLDRQELLPEETRGQQLKIKIPDGFLKDESKLRKAWMQVMKCFDFTKRLEALEIPVYKTTNISYHYDSANERFVKADPKGANQVKQTSEEKERLAGMTFPEVSIEAWMQTYPGLSPKSTSCKHCKGTIVTSRPFLTTDYAGFIAFNCPHCGGEHKASSAIPISPAEIKAWRGQ